VELFAFAASSVAMQRQCNDGVQSRLAPQTGIKIMRNFATIILASIAAVSISGTLFAGILA